MAASHLQPWERALIPCLGGIAAGSVLSLHQARGVRSEYMEAVVVGEGLLDIREGLVRTVVSLLVVSTGGAIGREGAMVALAAVLASWLAQALRLRRRERHLMVCCGAAAGLASAYNAPVGSAVFVAEVLLGHLALRTEAPLLVAAVTASSTLQAIEGSRAFFTVPSLNPPDGVALAMMLGVGLVCSLVAPLFLEWLEAARGAFAGLHLPQPVTLGLGGLLVGLLSVFRPEVWGNGYSVVGGLLSSPPGWRMVLVLLVFKLLAVGATTGSGAPGGVFTPTLFVGASLGTLLGYTVTGWSSGDPRLTLCTLAGMGALLAGTTHAPLTAALMTFEMIRRGAVLAPLMLVCVLSAVVSRALHSLSIYSEAIGPRTRTGRSAEVHSSSTLTRS